MSSQDSSESWHCTVVPNCPFEQFSRCLKAHKRDYHSKFNSFPYKGHSETMHRRSDGKFDCPCGHPMHRRFSYEKLRALCRAGIHPPPETTKYNDFPIDNALSLTKHFQSQMNRRQMTLLYPPDLALRVLLPMFLQMLKPKNRAKELERKGVIVDSKGIKHKLKNDTSRPLVQTGGWSIRGSSHDQAPASGSSPAGNPQGDQNCNTQFSGLPSRSNNPSSLPETDALVQKAATLKRERAVLEEELVNKRMEIIGYIATLEVENLARRRKLSIMDKVMRV
ncbi:hypothetical protein BDP27DRAFT_1366432 [Rhodocollybia butyracea]|uniref:Uncharacterized protein n=1 Tax=Rhodocollybia butyracea TaxID=206335 RepID=A0A9P5PHF0_9AGAR|nr:hypothetical protein BDP27DRAFT_1366432 [Rhodocollybia butyracea]